MALWIGGVADKIMTWNIVVDDRMAEIICPVPTARMLAYVDIGSPIGFGIFFLRSGIHNLHTYVRLLNYS
jgi:hypothetical protein